MRYLVLILALGILIPQENYPPELPPIPSEEMILQAIGVMAPDEPIEYIEGDVVYADILVALASGVDPGICQRGINRINITASNSGVATAQVRLVKCLSTTYVSSGSASLDLSRSRTIGDGFLDEIHTERDLNGADTVIQIGKSGDSCGIAYLTSGPTTAFAYVMDGCESNSSIEHEWGHNVGMNHDLPNAQNPNYPYHYGWCFGNGFKDVMTYPDPCGGSRSAFYSNPDIIYNGRATGTATANNARVLRERIAVIANFRNSVTSFPPTNHLRD